ncbi:hypothetical protein VIGAN_10108800 [Vigna angularis var. angularis]|uniref:Uncharacterized protein n=1 Tax=Vigna angularis var. angularis TaxID=157739 RepID=A0A0S3T2Y1_PHAAN|nr:hypothetical protein VIGAN_10108800 [Vigna angularis var. angularis]
MGVSWTVLLSFQKRHALLTKKLTVLCFCGMVESLRPAGAGSKEMSSSFVTARSAVKGNDTGSFRL